MSDTGAEVTSGVDCVSGGAAQGVTDDDDDEGNAKRANRGFGVTGNEDPQDQDGSADGLSDAVPSVRANLGAGREDTELQSRIAILIEVLLEGEPAQDSTDKCAEELGNDVYGNIRAGDKNSSSLFCRNAVESHAGVKEVGDNLCNGDCGVQVSTGTESDINTCKYCKSPSEVDHEPTATLALGLGEQVRGNDASTKEKKYCSSKELRPEDLCRCHRN